MSSIHITNMPPRSRYKVQSATTVEEETIDIEVSETSEDEDNPPAPAKASVVPTAGDETTRVAPIIKPVVKSNRALDIDLLFDRGKGKPSVCKYCK